MWKSFLIVLFLVIDLRISFITSGTSRGTVSIILRCSSFSSSLRNSSNYSEFRIDNDDIRKLLDTARKFQSTVMYKNPYAYILGFIASQGGREITKKSFDTAVKLLSNVEGGSVRPEDILRYARFWMITLK